MIGEKYVSLKFNQSLVRVVMGQFTALMTAVLTAMSPSRSSFHSTQIILISSNASRVKQS